MHIDTKVDVNVPLRTAYDQWTQFEEFPRFMEGVREVQQLGDERLYWVADVGGVIKGWYALITRQVPDEVLAWKGLDGATNSGTVIFHRLDDHSTQIELHMEFEDSAPDQRGAVQRRVEADLERFKEFIEKRNTETGAFRGEIIHGHAVNERGGQH